MELTSLANNTTNGTIKSAVLRSRLKQTYDATFRNNMQVILLSAFRNLLFTDCRTVILTEGRTKFLDS